MTALRDFDWSELVFDLKRAGMSHGEICVALSNAVSESGIRAYMAGGQPGHWRGELLLDLWVKTTGRPRSKAPTRPAPMRHISEQRRHGGFRPVARGETEALEHLYGVPVSKLMEAIKRATEPAPKPRKRPYNPTLPLPGFEIVEEVEKV